MQFEYGLQYEALLQIIEDDEYLCHGINDTRREDGWEPGFVVGPHGHKGRLPGHYSYGGIGDLEEEVEFTQYNIRRSDGIGVKNEVSLGGKNKNNTVDNKIHVVPSSGVPGEFSKKC